MSAERRTRQWLERMAIANAPPEPAARAVLRRQQVVEALSELHEQLLARQARSRIWRQRLSRLAIAATPLLLLAGVLGYWRSSAGVDAPQATRAAAPLRLVVDRGSAAVVEEGKEQRMTAPRSLELFAGMEIATQPASDAHLVLRDGTRVEILSSTRLAVEPRWGSARIDLRRGAVRVAVPPLPPPRTFAVHTPDASVEVHGTRFSVGVTTIAPGDTNTRVTVEEGEVLVRRGHQSAFLGAGATWSSSAEAVTADASSENTAEARQDTFRDPAHRSSVLRAAPRSAEPRPESRTQKATRNPREPASPTSDLGRQNELFLQARQARRESQEARALTLLGRLLVRYPRTALAQEARVERLRALRSLGWQSEAASEARRYLADYPHGFAREEARALALRKGPATDARAGRGE